MSQEDSGVDNVGNNEAPHDDISVEVSDVLPPNFLWTTQGRVNNVLANISMDPRSLHNFLPIERAIRDNIKFSCIQSTIKSSKYSKYLTCMMAYEVPLQIGDWVGATNFMVVDVESDDVSLGADFLESIRPWTLAQNRLTISVFH